MPSLPPEVLNRVFQQAGSPVTFDTFSEKSSDLRSFALVDKTWSKESQRVLAKNPVIQLKGPEGTKASDVVDAFLESDLNSATFEHLRIVGNKLELHTSKSIETRLGETLKGISLYSVTLDADFLLALPALERLSLSEVTFSATSSSTKGTLPRLTDLSVHETEKLPHCLHPEQLPTLLRLAINEPLAWADKWTFDKLVKMLDGHLEFYSCDANGETICDDRIEAIADKTLWDLEQEMFEDDPRELEDSLLSSFKHVRITHSTLGPMGDESPHERLSVKHLKTLLKMVFVDLETLVVPAFWQESPLIKEFSKMVKGQKVELLFDGLGDGESLISPSFTAAVQRRKKEGKWY